MFFEPIIAALFIAVTSLVGVFFFGNTKQFTGLQKYIVPAAVGVFLSLVLFELIPETLEAAPVYGGIAVACGFIAFYILSSFLHQKFHCHIEDDCERKESAILLLVGDAVHNLADGIILGGAFLIDPGVGFAVAIGLALHEIPQEIVEFGVLVRAGYSRVRAALYNLLSASSIVLGTIFILLIAGHADEYIWVLTGVAAGNLLFLAASDLLPRIHGDLERYGSVWHSSISIIVGFVVMTSVLTWTHEQFGHGHDDAELHEEWPEHMAHSNHEHAH